MAYKKMKITNNQLLEFGMKKNKNGDKLLFPMEKIISMPNEDNEGNIAICLTNMRNQTELCLMLPNGDCIYLSIETIEKLKIFEKCIGSWEPSY